ncbi:hypothetical protein HJG60_012283 [Phyllostomus discolor]|uniref:Uncharacterized protein n=1 Tax=Phyllostomus discolor TaxID=89673 RepID=A0A833ZE76_9CHIR|nr:hypothetical protein HJG60_012283 [Phyllostomus discolor]
MSLLVAPGEALGESTFCITMQWKANRRRAGSWGASTNTSPKIHCICPTLEWTSLAVGVLGERGSTSPSTGDMPNAGLSTLPFILTSTLKSMQMMKLMLREVTSGSQHHMAQVNGRALTVDLDPS